MRQIVIIALLFLVHVTAVVKTCTYGSMSYNPERRVKSQGNSCTTTCYDCQDQIWAQEILHDLELLDPKLNLTTAISTSLTTIKHICTTDLNTNDVNWIDCGSGTCTNECRICHELDLCQALKLPMITLDTANQTLPFVVEKVTSYINTTCANVTANAAYLCSPKWDVALLVLVLVFGTMTHVF